MNKFTEKLNSKLEELKSSVMLNNKCCKHIIDKIVEIVNQLAEEYKHCTLCYLQSPCEYQNENAILPNELLADKNGWIPCSERLPDRISPFQTSEYTVTMRFVKNGKKGRPFTSHASFDFEAEKWLVREHEVIAWREKIAPYQPKGE